MSRMILLCLVLAALPSACSMANSGRVSVQSVVECASVAEDVPGIAATYNASGICYMNIGYYQKAVDDFTKAITTDRNFTEAYRNRSYAYSKLNYSHLAFQDVLDSTVRNEGPRPGQPILQVRTSSAPK